MKKKGNAGMYIVIVVGLVVGVLLIVNAIIPQARLMTTPQQYEESIAHTKGTANTSTTLTQTTLGLETNSLIVGGLVNGTNYTIDYTTGELIILNDTNTGTYTAAYNYYAAGYITDAGTMAMASVLVLFVIVGFVGAAFKMFGLI